MLNKIPGAAFGSPLLVFVLSQISGLDFARMVVPAVIGVGSGAVSGLLSRSRSHDERRIEQLERRVETLTELVHSLDKELAVLQRRPTKAKHRAG